MNELKVPVTAKDHVRGPLDAQIVLVEYGDFQCPYCAAAYPELERLVEDLKDQVCFAFRHFPLANVHQYATFAALASEATDQQGKFWPMHHLIFESNSMLSEKRIVHLAESLNINMERFAQDMEKAELMDRVEKDFRMGVRSGVEGTPTLFLNGKHYRGNARYRDLMLAIEEELGRREGAETSTMF